MEKLEMPRGLLQTLFRYLPNSYIDFDSGNAIAKVDKWDSRPLKDVNGERILKRINKTVNSFKELKGISDNINMDDYELMKPKYIYVKAHPLVFTCKKCNRGYNFKSINNMRKSLGNRYRCKCGNRLTQMDLIYTCKCGWADQIYIKPCKNHGYDHIYYRHNNEMAKRTWFCSKDGHTQPFFGKCPECGERILPVPFRQFDVYNPKTLTMIDLIESKEEKLLDEQKIQKIIHAKYLDIINQKETLKLIDGILNKDEANQDEELKETIEMLKAAMMPEEEAFIYAKKIIKNNDPNSKLDKVLSQLDEKINNSDEGYYSNAVSLLEYDAVLNSKMVSTIDEAIQRAKQLSSSSNPYDFYNVRDNYGFKNIQACSGVPMIFASYGYTRRVSDPEGAVLRGFPQDKEQESSGKKPIYGTKLETEGILFEFDRKKILKWLLRNNFINEIEDNVPQNLDDEGAIKAWFLNNIKTEEIDRYKEIENFEKITKQVYTLLHSASHALMKKAADLCGLAIDSLSEYIFPSVPAVFIYCHNAQGFKLGAMFNLFQAFLDKWIIEAVNYTKDCLYDPICIEEKGACLGCLHINEISCEHFNKDLDRAYLIGKIDEEKRIIGFWE